MQANITAMLERGVNSTDEEPCHTPYCGSYDDQVRRPELRLCSTVSSMLVLSRCWCCVYSVCGDAC